MYGNKPVITRLDAPADILGLELIKEFLGLDGTLDAGQDRVLPVLRQAAVDQGEQITGIVWRRATYRMDGLVSRRPGTGVILPLTPVFAVDSVTGKDPAGKDVDMPETAYRLIPSAIELGRPWAGLMPEDAWPDEAFTLSVVCTAGWTEETLPESLRAWLLNRVAGLFDMRGDVTDGSGNPAKMPRIHALGLLDRWTVRGMPEWSEI